MVILTCKFSKLIALLPVSNVIIIVLLYALFQAGLDLMSRGHMLADVVAILGDCCMFCHDLPSHTVKSD